MENSNIHGVSPAARNTVEKIEVLVCKMFKVDRDFVRAKTRARANVKVRHAIFYILSKKCGMLSTMIARMYGMDHTTILYGIDQIKKNSLLETRLTKKVDELYEYIPYYSLRPRISVDKGV